MKKKQITDLFERFENVRYFFELYPQYHFVDVNKMIGFG